MSPRAPSSSPRVRTLRRRPSERAIALGREGDPELARAEFDALGLSARTAPREVLYTAAFVLAQAGSPTNPIRCCERDSPRTIHRAPSSWTGPTTTPKGSDYRAVWELAYPPAPTRASWPPPPPGRASRGMVHAIMARRVGVRTPRRLPRKGLRPDAAHRSDG